MWIAYNVVTVPSLNPASQHRAVESCIRNRTNGYLNENHTKMQFYLRHSGPRFNIKITSYQYRKSHCGDKTILRSSYLHNGVSYTGKMTSLYWIGTLAPIWHRILLWYFFGAVALGQMIAPVPVKQPRKIRMNTLARSTENLSLAKTKHKHVHVRHWCLLGFNICTQLLLISLVSVIAFPHWEGSVHTLDKIAALIDWGTW